MLDKKSFSVEQSILVKTNNYKFINRKQSCILCPILAASTHIINQMKFSTAARGSYFSHKFSAKIFIKESIVPLICREQSK